MLTDKLKSDKVILKKFGVSLGLFLLVITFIISRKSPSNIWPTFLLSGTTFALSLIKPFLLKPVYETFMKLSFILNWLFTRIILLIIFYLLVTPIGLTLKLFKIDLLEKEIDRKAVSYWKKKESGSCGLSGYEKQF